MTSVSIQSVPGQAYRQQITAGGHTFYADVPTDKGGADTGPDPHQYMLGALGACTAMTLQMYANRKGWDLRQVTVNIDETPERVPGQAGTRPKITKNISVQGNLDSQQVDTLKTIAEKCPVNKLLMGDKQMESSLNLVV